MPQPKQLKNLQSLKTVPLLIPLMMPMFKLAKGQLLMRFLEEARKESIDFDAVLVPVGGGGLIAGVSPISRKQVQRLKLLG